MPFNLSSRDHHGLNSQSYICLQAFIAPLPTPHVPPGQDTSKLYHKDRSFSGVWVNTDYQQVTSCLLQQGKSTTCADLRKQKKVA